MKPAARPPIVPPPPICLEHNIASYDMCWKCERYNRWLAYVMCSIIALIVIVGVLFIVVACK